MKRTRATTTVKTGTGNRPLALLTDFGSADHYVGTMKGVILSLNPKATIVDISHEVTPYDVREAGYLLWASYRYFPRNTVFVCVVDPGVGGGRRIVYCEAGKMAFVAPDNGLLDFVLLEEKIHEGFEVIQGGAKGTSEISPTFHGRDIFAPFAVLLSLGRPVRQLVRHVALDRPQSPFFEANASGTTARILHVDRFGNLVTNIPGRYFQDCDVFVGKTRVSRHVRTFSEAAKGEACLIVGSSGLIEIVTRESGAAAMLGAGLRTPLGVTDAVR